MRDAKKAGAYHARLGGCCLSCAVGEGELRYLRVEAARGCLIARPQACGLMTAILPERVIIFTS